MDLNHKILGEGDPIIIMHGLFGMLDNWMSIAKDLSKDYMVVLLDLRNHGKSPHSEEWNFELMTQDVIDFMEEQWIYEASIIGHSMGGKVAMNIALTEPDLVQKLIVADIAPKAYSPGHQLIFDALLSVPIDEIKSRKEAEKFLEQKINDWGIRQFLLKNITRKKDKGFKWKMNLKSIINNYPNILKAIDSDTACECPSLFLKGANSNYILEEDYQEIKVLFPNANIKIIQEAGHWVHAEQKESTIIEIRNFLMEV